jgi:23S rRNA pseudouridine2605 synthase
VTTHRDPEGRPTVFERLPKELGRVISVGRLDIASEGLLLLTNSGTLARRLELPSTGWTRRYRVRVFGTVNEKALAGLGKGITVDGVRYGPVQAGIDAASGSNTWLTLSLKEGKNREIRRVLEHLGLQVNRLIRVGYGPFQLGNLQRGEVEEVQRRVIRDQLGKEFVA